MKLYGEQHDTSQKPTPFQRSISPDWHIFLWPTMRYHWEGISTSQKNRSFDSNWFPVAGVMVLLFSLVTSLPRHLCSPRVQRSSRMKLCSQAFSSIAIDDLSSFKVAIVGGGYTGLACGYHIQQLFLNSTMPVPKHLNLSIFAREPEPTGTIHGTWCASAVSAGLLVSVYLSQSAVIPIRILYTYLYSLVY